MTRGSSICKGYGFATFSDELAAQRLLAGAAVPPQTMNRGALSIGVLQCGRRVGLHASRRPFRAVLSVAQEAAQLQPLHLSPEPGASINGLLLALREHPDQRAAVAAALQVWESHSRPGAYGWAGAASYVLMNVEQYVNLW